MDVDENHTGRYAAFAEAWVLTRREMYIIFQVESRRQWHGEAVT